MESAANVLTCVTPKHEIYSNLLSRYVKPQEYLNAQGIWRVDAENVQAYDKMLENGLAQELAGNSFTSTVVQAVVLASFVTCECWLHIDLQEMPAKPMVAPKILKQSRQHMLQIKLCPMRGKLGRLTRSLPLTVSRKV